MNKEEAQKENVRLMVELIVKALVDQPDLVDVSIRIGEQTNAFDVRCAKTDVGKVIGKQGNTARALRTILNSVSTKHGFRSILEIID